MPKTRRGQKHCLLWKGNIKQEVASQIKAASWMSLKRATAMFVFAWYLKSGLNQNTFFFKEVNFNCFCIASKYIRYPLFVFLSNEVYCSVNWITETLFTRRMYLAFNAIVSSIARGLFSTYEHIFLNVTMETCLCVYSVNKDGCTFHHWCLWRK